MRTPKPVSFASHAIQDFSSGLRASTVRLVRFRAHPRGAFSGAGVHGRTLPTVRFTVNTTVNTIKELGGRAWTRVALFRAGKTCSNLLKYSQLGRDTVSSGRVWPQHQRESHNLKVAGSNPAPATKPDRKYSANTDS